MKNTKEYYCKIGPVQVKLHCNDETSNLIRRDLGASEANENDENDEADIEVIIETSKPRSENASRIFSAKGNMHFSENEYFVGYLGMLNYTIRNLFESNCVKIEIHNEKVNIKKRILGFIKNINVLEKNAVLSYSLFWYVMHITLLKKNCAFIHSGVIESAKGATLIVGTGGCGKTSTLFKILEDEQFKYLSEDFGIVDDAGFTYFNAKPVSVYSTDMEFGQTILKDHFTKFSNIEKIAWYVRRKILGLNPMVKIPPTQLMNNRVGEKAKIACVLYFVRNNDEYISVSDASCDELTERALDASMRELKTLNELLLLMRANAPTEYEIPSFEDIRNQTKAVYHKVFQNSKRKIIYIPHKTTPVALSEFLKNKGLI